MLGNILENRKTETYERITNNKNKKLVLGQIQRDNTEII